MTMPVPEPGTPPDPDSTPVQARNQAGEEIEGTSNAMEPPADAVADPTGEGGRRPLDPTMASAEDPEALSSEEAMEGAVEAAGLDDGGVPLGTDESAYAEREDKVPADRERPADKSGLREAEARDETRDAGDARVDAP